MTTLILTKLTDCFIPFAVLTFFYNNRQGRCGSDHMVVGFTTTYAIGAYHH
jgi:hypothetical protein